MCPPADCPRAGYVPRPCTASERWGRGWGEGWDGGWNCVRVAFNRVESRRGTHITSDHNGCLVGTELVRVLTRPGERLAGITTCGGGIETEVNGRVVSDSRGGVNDKARERGLREVDKTHARGQSVRTI